MLKIRVSAIIVLFLLLTSCVKNGGRLTEEREAEIKTEIDQTFKGLVEAAESLDVERYLEFFDSEKFTALNEDGTVTSAFEEFEKSYRAQIKTVAKYDSLEFKNVKITLINAETAVLVNEYDAQVILNSGSSISFSGAGTQVWSKTNGDWKLVNVSSSSRPPEKPEQNRSE